MDVLFSSVDQSEYLNSLNFNQSVNITDLYEIYRFKERYRLRTYKYVGYVLGTVIVLSNLPVVVSSGLLLRKGQKPRSTYMLMGNVSLADTIVGVSLIFGVLVDAHKSPSILCVIETGMMACPAMVSIFTVGLIAVDRYIYILHGLYYKRWFNTTRVRIGIVLIWMIGIVLGFMPATGWVSEELYMTRCFYVSLFPGKLILLNSFLSIIPIAVVVVLYSIILVKALKTVKTINGTIKIKEVTPASEKPKLRMNRGTVIEKRMQSQSVELKSDIKLKRSASFTLGTSLKINPSDRSKSIDDLAGINRFRKKDVKNSNGRSDSDFSIYTVESVASFNLSVKNERDLEHRYTKPRCSKLRRPKEPNKWRAITVVLLTTGAFIITWIPFFIAVIFFVYCEEKLTNPKCIRLRFLLGGPFPFLAFTNSIVNPLIYAWWHKGFKKSVKSYYKRYILKYFCHDVL